LIRVRFLVAQENLVGLLSVMENMQTVVVERHHPGAHFLTVDGAVVPGNVHLIDTVFDCDCIERHAFLL
jgi:hypothetical protein